MLAKTASPIPISVIATGEDNDGEGYIGSNSSCRAASSSARTAQIQPILRKRTKRTVQTMAIAARTSG